uniref:Cyclin n=1 Tax=Kalanchoe fedtschenkoi TaxID=63787 RepID=A0A7N0T3T5_KALFE
MVTVAVEREMADSELYQALGLQLASRRSTRKPQILSILPLVFDRIVKKNDTLIQSKQIKDIVSDFHGIKAPDLGIQQYLERIFTYSSCSPSCFVIARIYIDRLLKRQSMHLTSLNVHRLLITGIMVAAKFMDDAFFNNAYYARVGGISTKELNKLEMTFLFGLDFRVHVTTDTFSKYCLMLHAEAPGVLKIERSIQGCGVKGTWSKKDDTTFASTAAR